MSIFGKYAPLYFAAGISVMPLGKRSKRPILNEWTAYGQEMPTKAMQDMWVREYADNNIGIPFGPASNLCAIDIDTDDEEMIQAILDELPDPIWIRKGKKGMGIIYKWSGQANFKLRNEANESVVEFLGYKNQLVAPGSIHPDTGRAYTANCNLWDVVGDLPALPVDIENRLREALGLKGVKLAKTTRSRPLEVVAPGERDNQLVRRAGYYARVVRGIDKGATATLAEAMAHMETWVREFTAGVAGDEMDPAKGVAKLLEFLMRDVEAGKTLPEGWDAGLDLEGHWKDELGAIAESQKNQRWTLSKAKAWFSAEIEGFKGDELNERVGGAIKRLRDMTADDDQFEDGDREMLAAALMKLGAKEAGLSKSGVMKGLKPDKGAGSGDEGAGSAEDQEAIARMVIEEMNRDGELRVSHDTFWQWNGSCFGELSSDDVYRTVAQSIKGNALSRRHADYLAIVKVMSKLLPQGLAEGTEDGINFANGFLDTELVLHDHNPKFGKTFTMPFNYIPERAGEAHKWFKYLEDCWGDDADYDAKVRALQEVFAATMFGIGTRFQRAILLYGLAGTGKSVLLEVLQSMMPPPAVCTVPPADWGARFQLTGLIGRALNVCGELPESGVIDGAVFKGVIGGESSKVEFKGRDIFNFRPFATHWFASNHLPRSRDSSMGFVRRWQIFEFSRVVAEEDRIEGFHEILVAQEREAIAAWAMQGLPRLLRQHDYTQPASHKSLLDDIYRSNNSIYTWLETNDQFVVTGDDEDTALASELFRAYAFFMKEFNRGWNAPYNTFLQEMHQIGHRGTDVKMHIGPKVRVLHGIREIKPEEKIRA